MNDHDNRQDQPDENMFLYEVSDEALEAEAAPGSRGELLMTIGPTVMMGGCC